MRLTTRTNLALRTLMACAVNKGRTLRTADIAQSCNASGNHLIQVVHLLQINGFVETIRGRHGGIKLAMPDDKISIGNVIRALESGIPFTECFDSDQNSCPLVQECRLKAVLSRALEAFYAELDKTSLADLVDDNCGLSDLLKIQDSFEKLCRESVI